MKTVSLVLLLVASVLSAPTEEVKPVLEVKEVKEVVEPQARALTATFLGATPYQPYQQQFGARLTPYYQPQYQYVSGQQQHTYIHGTPTQTYMSGSPYYHHGAQGAKYYQAGQGAQYYQGGLGAQYYQAGLGGQYYQDAAYYPGAPGHFVQPAGGYHSKKVVQPTPIAVKTHAVPTPTSISAHVVKTAVPAPAGVAVHEYERFAAPAVVRAHAAPTHTPAHIVKASHPVLHPTAVEPFHVIVKQANDDNFDGSFAYSYETDHGIAVESSGYLKNAGTPDQVQVMQGSYTYYTPEGVPIITTYIADENGFQVQGDHLPVAPPMPEAIARSIEYQRSLPPSEEDIVEQKRAKAFDKQ